MWASEIGLGEARIIHLHRSEDYRGSYTETWNSSFNSDYFRNLVPDFIQDDVSVSRKDVLRGLHGDNKTWKLISCPYGKIYLVIVDMDVDSITFGKWDSFIISGENATQVLIPPKFANGHLVLSEEAVCSYKQTEEYDRKSQFSIYFSDQYLDIQWPIDNPILSHRDKFEAMSFYDYCEQNNALEQFKRLT